MSEEQRAISRHRWIAEANDASINGGSFQRIADALESALAWSKNWPGFRMAHSIIKIANKGVTIHHSWEVKIRIEWPWLRRMLAARKHPAGKKARK